ncbi:MAG: TVP38/TMEM64 family protein [Thermodesulfobacteriota bacterium]|jgi:uncharacterized membrane protein YdjX (TVP38/TMEM64 family)|nr:TVP38/TMEM64 family protein [Thermodesulfobacteriota bacterium]
MSRSKILILCSVLLLVALFFSLNLGQYLTLEALRANQRNLMDFYADNKTLMVAAFMLLYILQSALSLPGATIFALTAGAVFGLFPGVLYALFSATIGATLCFLAVRHLFFEKVAKRFGPSLDKINQELIKRGLSYLLFVRLVPVFPFFLINLAAGLTRMPLRTFVTGSFFGMIPGGLAYVNAGASLASINSLGDVVSPRVLGAFVLLGLLSLSPAIYTRLSNKKT